jgi:membrane-associated protease RseP (regulator of RpoE activity)
MSNPENDPSLSRPSPQWEYIPRDDSERRREFASEAGLGDDSGTSTERHAGPLASRPTRLKWPIFLFVATCVSTWLTGGPIYSAAIVTILLCHEFGHYIQARRYHVPASLPYFIPMPFSPLGTMGAVIGMSGRIPNRKALFDIGISGPLAGLGPALFVTWLGLEWSNLAPNEAVPRGSLLFNEPLIFDLLAYLKFGAIPDTMFINAHPLALAGWAGIFVTALNLIPIGQLDGGHILYAMLRQWSYPITTLLLYGSLAAMVLTGSYVWLLMVMLLLLSGPNHPPTHDDSQPLGRGRTILGWVTLAFIVVGFTPVPITVVP